MDYKRVIPSQQLINTCVGAVSLFPVVIKNIETIVYKKNEKELKE